MNDNSHKHNEDLPVAEEPTTAIAPTSHTPTSPLADMVEFVSDEEIGQFIPLEESKQMLEKMVSEHYHPNE